MSQCWTTTCQQKSFLVLFASIPRSPPIPSSFSYKSMNIQPSTAKKKASTQNWGLRLPQFAMFLKSYVYQCPFRRVWLPFVNKASHSACCAEFLAPWSQMLAKWVCANSPWSCSLGKEKRLWTPGLAPEITGKHDHMVLLPHLRGYPKIYLK